ncbi:MAG: DNA-processing protein DprA [Proteobacteria bacterium]|nr:DNA-processing protein DprA [Pseudomonadota bacterium]
MFKRIHISQHSSRLENRAKAFPSYFSHPWLLNRGKSLESENLEKTPSLAVVGTRRPSSYGIKHCRRVISKLAFESSQIQINSGGALGIDACAHRAALDFGLKTHAWLVGPIMNPSPRYNSSIFSEMIHSGLGSLWVPELLEPSDKVNIHKSFWILRNFWLVAASDAVLVIEASENSGTWWTVRAASEMGVPVFALPGPVDTGQSTGTNRMISSGYAHSLDSIAILTKCLLVDFVKNSYNHI